MKTFLASLILVAVLCLTVRAQSQTFGLHGVGPRVGLTGDPDQFRFGGQLDFGDIAPNLMLIPNLEIGVGDDITTVAPTVDFDYRFRSDYGAWTPYVGAGVGPIFYSYRHGYDQSDVGVYLQGGIMKELTAISPTRFFMEARLGLADAPDFGFTVGWTFGH